MKRRGMRLMQVAAVLAVVLSGCASGERPPGSDAGGGAAREMARLLSEAGSWDRALDLGAEAALDSTVEALEVRLGRSLSDEEQARVRGILRSALAEIVTADLWEQTLSAVYADQFSDPEITAALKFYRSPLGRKILDRDADMEKQMEQRILSGFEARQDEFAQRVDAALAEAIPQGAGETSP